MKTNSNRPALNLRNASAQQQIAKVQSLVRGGKNLTPELQGKTFYADVEPALGEVLAARAEIAEYRSKLKAAMVREKAALKRMRGAARRYTNSVASFLNFDPVQMVNVGLTLARSRQISVGLPPEPSHLRADFCGENFRLRWRCKQSRCWFEVAYAEGTPEGQWVHPTDWKVSRCRFILSELKPGTVYWLRVKAFNANGESDWSQMVRLQA